MLRHATPASIALTSSFTPCFAWVQPVFRPDGTGWNPGSEGISPGVAADKHTSEPRKPGASDGSVRLCPWLSVMCRVYAEECSVACLSCACRGMHGHRCLCSPSLSAVMAMHTHCDQSRLVWWAFLLCRKRVCAPKGGIKSL